MELRPAPLPGRVWGQLEVDARPSNRFIRAAAVRHCTLTPTHLVSRAIAHAQQGTIDVVFTTSTCGGGDVTGVKIADVHAKSAVAVARELDLRNQWVAVGEDRFLRAKRIARRLPPPVFDAAYRAARWATRWSNAPLAALGLPTGAWGNAIVTDVASLGFPEGFAPLVHLPGAPLHIAVGGIVGRADVTANGTIRTEVVPTLVLGISCGVGAARRGQLAAVVRALQSYLAEPEAYEPAWGPIPIRAHMDPLPDDGPLDEPALRALAGAPVLQ